MVRIKMRFVSYGIRSRWKLPDFLPAKCFGMEEIMNNKVLDCIALTIAIIGAVNWGLIGFFSFDLVAMIFGNMSWISRIVYALVGLSGLYLLTFYMYAGGTETHGAERSVG